MKTRQIVIILFLVIGSTTARHSGHTIATRHDDDQSHHAESSSHEKDVEFARMKMDADCLEEKIEEEKLRFIDILDCIEVPQDKEDEEIGVLKRSLLSTIFQNQKRFITAADGGTRPSFGKRAKFFKYDEDLYDKRFGTFGGKKRFSSFNGKRGFGTFNG